MGIDAAEISIESNPTEENLDSVQVETGLVWIDPELDIPDSGT